MRRRALEFSSVVSKEGRWYIARCPELEVTSQRKSVNRHLRILGRLSCSTWRMKTPRFLSQLPTDRFAFVGAAVPSPLSPKNLKRVRRERPSARIMFSMPASAQVL